MAHRLNKVTREFNVGISTIVEFLAKKGHKIGYDPNEKISDDLYLLLVDEFSSQKRVVDESKHVDLAEMRKKKETISLDDVESHKEAPVEEFEQDELPDVSIKIVGKIDLLSLNQKTRPDKKPYKPEEIEKPKEIETQPKPSAETEKHKKSIQPETVTPTDDFIKPKTANQTLVEEEITPEIAVLEDELFTPDREPIDSSVKVVGKIDLDTLNQKTRPDKKTKEEREQERQERRLRDAVKEPEILPQEINIDKISLASKEHFKDSKKLFRAPADKLDGPTIIGKITLQTDKDSDDDDDVKRKKRKRISKEKIDILEKSASPKSGLPTSPGITKPGFKKKKKFEKREVATTEDVQKQIKETFTQLYGKEKNKAIKYRRDKRDAARHEMQEEADRLEEEKRIIKVTEFISVSDLAKMVDVSVTEIISTCMSVGLFVSINQRLDAETIALISEEFGYGVEFVSVEIQDAIEDEVDTEETLISRPPIVTVMGHVDHGKTSLLDYIRKANVIAGEAGGITQHIGAYGVILPDEQKITFLDTPGHEAFTAMRARGAKATDIAIIVVAADDSVMPQTVEAINHASAAGVPIVFAINKIDKEGANPDRIKEQLSAMNYLVEDWGGKYQSQEISAKKGTNVGVLLEKVLLEAEMLQLKANPNRRAKGTVIESQLDKGRGYISTVLVETGTLEMGDVILAGQYTGRIKAMFNERNQRVKSAGPSEPVIVLGLNGAPQAGDRFNAMANEKEAKDIATKREQLMREQTLRTHKHITLDEIGRRLAIGNFKQLNIIIKGDVDGSVEALGDSLIKLSNEEILVKVIHKAVGSITESDVMLASASDAIIIGFQVRPSANARKLAENEEIDIRLYSIIYDAINDLKDAMTGMLSPEMKEEITATLEIREVFKITKAGTVAGCFVTDGKIDRKNKIRVIREGIVVYEGELGSLKRFKDDVKDVARGFECGLNITNFNDIKVGDIIESYEIKEIKRKL